MGSKATLHSERQSGAKGDTQGKKQHTRHRNRHSYGGERAAARAGKLEKRATQPLEGYRSVPTDACRNMLLHRDLVAGAGLEPATHGL